MKRLVIIAVVVALGGSSWATIIGDLSGFDDTNPAPFRGEEGSTLQAWDFTTNTTNSTPDVWDDLNPVPESHIVNPGNYYVSNDFEHVGVWNIQGDSASGMIVHISNFSQPKETKKIWVQLVYDSGIQDLPPWLFVLPNGDEDPAPPTMVLEEFHQVDDIYAKATFSLEIHPNPPHELIRIRPRYWNVYIDQIIVETQCIPEPMTMVLLGMGGLLVLMKRR